MDSEALATSPLSDRGMVQRRWPLVALGLVVLVLLAYWPAVSAGYIWDDDAHITRNYALRSAEGLWRIWTQFGATPQYYPLTHTTFWLEYHLWGLNPTGYHLTNILLHGLGAVVLWRLLRALAVPGALIVASLFAVHPLHVETVAWITERKNVLAWLLYFCAFRVYWSMLGEIGPDRAPEFHRGRYVLALGLAVLALLSKTVTSTLPAAILLAIWWKRGTLGGRGRGLWRDVLPLLPMFAIGAVLGSITSWRERTFVGAQGPDWDVLTFADRVLIAGRALWFYADKLIRPVDLCFNYERWSLDPHDLLQWLFPMAAVLVIGMLLVLRKRIGRGPPAAVLFYCGTLFPALGFFNIYPMRYSFVADHFAYPATVGLLCLIVGALATSRLAARMRNVLAGVAVFGCAGLTFLHVGNYADADGLWIDTIEKNPASWLAMCNLAGGRLDRAQSLVQRQRVEVAASLEPLLRRALELRPQYYGTVTFLGMVQRIQGRPDEAIATWSTLPEAGKVPAVGERDRADALACCGVCWYEDKQDAAVAEQYLLRALEVEPRQPLALFSLASMRCDQGRYTESLALLQKLLQQSRYEPAIWAEVADVYVQAKQNDVAIRACRTALGFDPECLPAQTCLVVALARSGQREQASGLLEQLRGMDSADPDVLVAQAQLAADAGQLGQARELVARVLVDHPYHAHARRLQRALPLP